MYLLASVVTPLASLDYCLFDKAGFPCPWFASEQIDLLHHLFLSQSLIGFSLVQGRII